VQLTTIEQLTQQGCVQVKYLSWLLKAAIFFTLFAFALNNQQIVAVNFFFGTSWKANLVLVVLTAFGIGLLLGVLLMMPRWWRNRQHRARLAPEPATRTPSNTAPTDSVSADTATIPRHGL
jgi:lipopolysaccharide assembly protein A